MGDALGSIVGGIGAVVGGDKAADASIRHLKKVQGVDIADAIKQAREQDVAKFKDQLDVWAEADPTFKAIRDAGGASLLKTILADSEPSAATRAISALEAVANDPKSEELIGTLTDRAKAELDAGATLPPEFQAELVRTGLENAGRSGENLDPNSAAGVRLRKLVGREGLNLQRNRESAATGFLGAADALKNSRANILKGIVSAESGLRTDVANRAGLASNVSTNMLPNIGIGGSDVVNMLIANQNLKNQIEVQRAGIASQEIANAWSGYAGIAKGVGDLAAAAATGGMSLAATEGGGMMGGGGGGVAAPANTGSSWNWGGMFKSMAGA